MSITAMKLIRDAIERGDDLTVIGAKHILDQAIAEAEKQEPVAWGVDWGKAGDTPCVSIIKRMPDGRIEVVAVEYAPYTHPPKREWVGLTDEEIEEVERWVEFKEEGSGRIPMIKLVKCVETKLKEKNT